MAYRKAFNMNYSQVYTLIELERIIDMNESNKFNGFSRSSLKLLTEKRLTSISVLVGFILYNSYVHYVLESPLFSTHSNLL